MFAKGVWMICLTALSGLWGVGCFRPTTLPPSTSIPRYRQPADKGLTKTQPLEPIEPQKPQTPQNPWEPTASERDWQYIVIHHTATSTGSVESIHESHLKRRDSNGNPWMGIGYHFVIGNGNGMEDGAIEPTFRWREQLHGAHAGDNDYNQQGVGIALIGNFEEAPPTSAQVESVKRLVRTLKAEYGISAANVVGHSDVKATACPGQYFPMAEVSQGFSTEYWGRRAEKDDSQSFASFKGNQAQ